MLDGVDVQTTNGLDLEALGKVVEAIENDARKAKVRFAVTTRWTGQTRSETLVEGFTIGGDRSPGRTRSSRTNPSSSSAATKHRTPRSC